MIYYSIQAIMIECDYWGVLSECRDKYDIIIDERVYGFGLVRLLE